jgi:TDG/mug DNA glycosylase family protein
VRIQSGLLPEPPLPSMETLPDYLRTGLDVVSIGLNPSLPSVRAGYYFANPRNRFWRALHGSRLVPSAAVMGPGIAAMETLLQHGIGFTDVVKRLFCAPRIAWFHGKQAYAGYLRYAEGITTDIEWGEQPLRVGDSRVFVTPNPSPANAVFSLADLIAWYVRLGEFRGRTGAGAE